MTRLHALLLVLAFWAAIFLPGLGSTEIKGEEGRRIMPGIDMLETGEWIVPSIGGQPYLRKPPLVNWMIAGAVATFDSRSEWVVRLPSVLMVLALGLVIAGVCSRWLGPETALAAAIFSIANVSLIEKGRLAEIEAIYVAFTGIATVLWMAWSLRSENGHPGVSKWLRWVVPFFFLGLGLLTKAPLHLLFFYVVVLATYRGRREFFSLPHFMGVLLAVGIFLAWAVPYFREAAHLNAAGVWEEQMRERVGGGNFKWKDWLLLLPRGMSNYLPWLLLVPVLWLRPAAEPWFRPVRNAVVGCFVILLLIPGVLPRYTQPLLVPLSVLLAMALRPGLCLLTGRGWPKVLWGGVPEGTAATSLVGKGRVRCFTAPGLALIGASMAAAAMLAFSIAIVPMVVKEDNIRPLGAEISKAVPPSEPLRVWDIGFQPVLFYLTPKLIYANEIEELPAEVPWMLAREKAPRKFEKHWTTVKIHREFQDKEGRRLILLSLSGRK
ncbi:MAG: ArnT family glycosyltransferase [Chthoniobacteraceae bacterium]